MPLSQSDINRIAEAVVARIALAAEERKKKQQRTPSMTEWQDALAEDKNNARSLVTPELVIKTSHGDASMYVIPNLTPQQWRMFATLSWKHLTPEDCAAFIAGRSAEVVAPAILEAAVAPEVAPEAAPEVAPVAAQKKPPNGYQQWLTCLVGDMSGARAMISQEVADWVVIEADPKRTVLFSGKPLSELDGRAWRALGVLAWKHISTEARAAFAAVHASNPLAFD